jgi:VWFA-related protein
MGKVITPTMWMTALLFLASRPLAALQGSIAPPAQASQAIPATTDTTPKPAATKPDPRSAPYHVFRAESLSLTEANLELEDTSSTPGNATAAGGAPAEETDSAPAGITQASAVSAAEMWSAPPVAEDVSDLGDEPAAVPTAFADTAGQLASAGSTKLDPALPVLHTSAKVVLVDVVVTDRGSTIHGLDRKRFHILENGHEQTITYFDEAQQAAPGSKSDVTCAASATPGIYSNVPCTPARGPVNVLLLDALNTPTINQADINRQVQQYLKRMKPGTSLAVFALNRRLQMLSGFTTDASQLIKVAQGKAAGPQVSVAMDNGMAASLRTMADRTPEQSSQIAVAQLRQAATEVTAQSAGQQAQLTMLALQQLARYLDAIPGRKNLIWFSGSFPISLAPDPMSQNQALLQRDPSLALGAAKNQQENGEPLRETVRLLSAARVAVYPVYALGPISTPSLNASYNMPGQQGLASIESGMDDQRSLDQSGASQDSMRQLAEYTGGHYVSTNGLAEAMSSAIQNGGNYYTIGYTPESKQLNGQYRNIKLKLDNAHYDLAYRRGYYVDPAANPSGRDGRRSSTLQASTVLGAPPATQLEFQARVLPASDPLFKEVNLPTGPAGAMAARLKGPSQRTIVDIALNPHGLTFEQTPEGAYRTQIEFAVVAYDMDGKRVNFVDQGIQLNLKAEQYARIMSANTRIPHRIAVDLPAGQMALRVIILDPAAAHTGSLEVPVTVAK